MKNIKMRRRIRAGLAHLGGALLVLTTSVHMAWADADSARNAGAAWLIKQQRGDGSWATASGDLSVQATAIALTALRIAGQSRSPSYSSGIAWLSNADADSVDAIARKVEALGQAGRTTVAKSEAARLYNLRAASDIAAWGGYGAVDTADFVDTALGLAALRVGDPTFTAKAYGTPVSTAMCLLIANRVTVASGKQAWPMSAVTMGANPNTNVLGRPSVVVTALLVAELRALQRTSVYGVNGYGVTCNPTAYTLSDMLAPAVAWLLDQQNTDGGFGEQRIDGSKGASTPMVSALVLKALTTQANVPQPQADNLRAWLLSKQNTNTGSWDADPLVTAAVVAALPVAAGAQLADADRDGLTDNVETQLNSDKATADAREQMGAPTLSVAGATSTSFTSSAVLGVAYQYSLGGSGSYVLTSGSLPPGLALNPSGAISGTPTQAGTYSFGYQSGGNGGDVVVGRIDVLVGETSTADTPLPAWALLALGASLIGALKRYR